MSMSVTVLTQNIAAMNPTGTDTAQVRSLTKFFYVLAFMFFMVLSEVTENKQSTQLASKNYYFLRGST